MDLIEVEHLKKHGFNPEDHWWETGRRLLFKSNFSNFLKPGMRVADFGAGSAVTVKDLASHNAAIDFYAFDINYSAAECGKKSSNLTYIRSIEEMPAKADLVLVMDVLEHIAQEREALKSIASLMGQTSQLLLTVPAHPWLWSGHDEILLHERRYTKESLRQIISENFNIISLKYHLSLPFPAAAFSRLVIEKILPRKATLSVPSVFFNRIGKIMMILEYSIGRVLHPFFGISLMVIAKKK